MDFDDKAKIPWPSKQSAAFQLRKLSEWWDREHQFLGLPHAAYSAFISMPYATRGARAERAQGWKWWFPNCAFFLSRGGYASLCVYVRGTGGKYVGALKREEQDVREQLELAGNCVLVVETWIEVVNTLAEYLAGNMVRPTEE